MKNEVRNLIIEAIVGAILSTLSIEEGETEFEGTIESQKMIEVLNGDNDDLKLVILREKGHFSAYLDKEILQVLAELPDFDTLLYEAGYNAIA